jgi:putative proteasome-type protease
MTYCVAMVLEDGLVCASDSRSNAGVDQITVYRKMHIFKPADDRVLIVMTAGNLATTQQLMHWVHRDLAQKSKPSLATVTYLFEAAEYIGELNREVQARHEEALKASGVDGQASLIVAGQIRGETPNAFQVYPQGNYIRASRGTPYLQIGESKYGKPVLGRVAERHMTLNNAARLALVSMDAAQRSNLSVGPPFELMLYRRDSFDIERHVTFEIESPVFANVRDAWHEELRSAFTRLPRFEWE